MLFTIPYTIFTSSPNSVPGWALLRESICTKSHCSWYSFFCYGSNTREPATDQIQIEPQSPDDLQPFEMSGMCWLLQKAIQQFSRMRATWQSCQMEVCRCGWSFRDSDGHRKQCIGSTSTILPFVLEAVVLDGHGKKGHVVSGALKVGSRSLYIDQLHLL